MLTYLNLFYDIQTTYHLSEDHVLVIQPTGRMGNVRSHVLQNKVLQSIHLPFCFFDGYEELRTIRSGARVSHAQNARAGMFEHKVLVVELFSIDGPSTSAIMLCEVTALQHESRNNSMESTSLVAESLFIRAEAAKVFDSLRADVGPQEHDDATDDCLPDLDVEVDLRILPSFLVLRGSRAVL